MNTLILVLLLQAVPLPPRSSLENPAAGANIPKQFKKDYDKAWARFLSANEDASVLRDADKLLNKQKDLEPVLLLEAYLNLYLGRSEDAERQFEKVLAKNPTSRVALFYLAELTYAREEFRKAGDFYGRLIELDHGRYDLEMKRQKALLLATDELLRKAVASMGEGRLGEAEGLYRQALQIAPEEPVLQGQLGLLLLMEEKWQDALNTFQRQADLSGLTADVKRHMADALTGLGRKEEASKLLAGLTTELPKDDFEHRAAELEDLGRWGADIEEFRKIKASEAITRQQLALMILRYFPQVSEAPQKRALILDIQDSPVWREIETVVGAGLFDLTPNRAFGPSETVSRGEFAMTMSRLIRLVGVTPHEAPPIPTPDVAASHAIYQDVQLVLQSGMLSLDNAGQFNVLAPVSGRQAVSAGEKLLAIIREKSQ
jgi:tetratricopeptide (TPR) repeat protein